MFICLNILHLFGSLLFGIHYAFNDIGVDSFFTLLVHAHKNKEDTQMLPEIKKLLYTTDLSDNSAYAFRYAINSAKQHDARIIILQRFL